MFDKETIFMVQPWFKKSQYIILIATSLYYLNRNSIIGIISNEN